MRLAVIAAEPGEVTIDGVDHLAPKIRVRDVGYLEAWFESVVPKPTGDDFRGHMEWPPLLGSDVSARLLNTNEGLARVVHASLRQIQPALAVADARKLAGTMTEIEAASFFLAVWPSIRSKKPATGHKPMDWHRAIKWVAKEYHFTPGECLDMPLDQFFALFEDPADDDRPARSGRQFQYPFQSPEEFEKTLAMLRERGEIQ
jgi:hypothetical protein